MDRRIVLLLILGLAAWLLLHLLPAPAQEIVPAVVPMPGATPYPSSYRYIQATAWFTDAHPVPEGAFGLPTDDANHLFVYHLNHWRVFALSTTVTP